MRTQSRVIGMGLCALALWAGAATGVAADQVADIVMVPRLTIAGTLGATDQIQYCTNLSQPQWVVLTNLVVAQTNYSFVDAGAPLAPRRFYRVVVSSLVVSPPDGMALIPAGSLTMGDSLDGDENSIPLHSVNVSAFFMDKYLVTKSLWDTVKAWNGGNGYGYDNAGAGKAPTHPVQTVNWYDVVKWCNARSEMEGLQPCYYADTNMAAVYKSGQVTNPWVNWSASGYRLPTEAEWEKAAWGGASGHRFPWSDVDSITQSRANYFSSTAYAFDVSTTRGYHPTFNDGVYPYTSPVGSFGANGYGLYDMAGNVWEWCWDWYGWYSSDSQTDPRGPASGWWRVVRGGCWSNDAMRCRSANRFSPNPTYSDNDSGFRCVRGLTTDTNTNTNTVPNPTDNNTNTAPNPTDTNTVTVLIPAGSFTMGDSLDGDENSIPQHSVNVSAFFMDKYLVTKSLWDTVKAWNGGNGYGYDNAGSGKAPTHPVQTVNWYDVVKWCNARSEMEGLQPCYYADTNMAAMYKSGQVTSPWVKWSASGYRLPTEAEWEKAARGGASGHRFPWSDVDSITQSRANYFSATAYSFDVSTTRGYHPTFNDGVYPYTSPVGSFGANGYGLYDMAGNVWEWCWDWYGWYSPDPQTDPRGPASGWWRVVRGGSWSNDAMRCRSANRFSPNPTYSDNDSGFRCVRVPSH